MAAKCIFMGSVVVRGIIVLVCLGNCLLGDRLRLPSWPRLFAPKRPGLRAENPSPQSQPEPLLNSRTSLRQRISEQGRRRGSRRANRERQIIGTVNALPAACNRNSEDMDESIVGCEFRLGEDLMQTSASNVNGKRDECPICLDRFHNELSRRWCVVLPCRHALCLACVQHLEESHKPCPYCRQRLGRVVHTAEDQILLTSDIQSLLELLEGIPLDEKRDLVRSLLRANKFTVFKVVEALEDMILGSLSVPTQPVPELWEEPPPASAREANVAALTPEEKEKIYIETQRPVLALREELRASEQQLRYHRNDKRGRPYRKTLQQTMKKRQHLLEAIRNDREDAYNQINARGSMGMIPAGRGDCQVDFHALQVRDAKVKFDELVLPLLPVLKKVRVITGRGSHSADGFGVLKQTLIAYIEDHPDTKVKQSIRWEPIAGNEGVIRVVWTRDVGRQA